VEKEKHNPGIAAVLSFVFSGLGQIYNGQIKKGLFVIFLSFLSIFILIIGAILIGFWLFGKVLFGHEFIWGMVIFAVGLLLICILGIWSIFDAYNVAKRD
jgi:Mn2+/Fe2+ NRAMP family transporter